MVNHDPSSLEWSPLRTPDNCMNVGADATFLKSFCASGNSTKPFLTRTSQYGSAAQPSFLWPTFSPL